MYELQKAYKKSRLRTYTNSLQMVDAFIDALKVHGEQEVNVSAAIQKLHKNLKVETDTLFCWEINGYGHSYAWIALYNVILQKWFLIYWNSVTQVIDLKMWTPIQFEKLMDNMNVLVNHPTKQQVEEVIKLVDDYYFFCAKPFHLVPFSIRIENLKLGMRSAL